MSTNTFTLERPNTTASLAERVFVADRAASAGSALEWPTWVVVSIGLGLAMNSLLLHMIVRRDDFSSLAAKASAEIDVAWMLTSLAIAAGLLGETSAVGRWMVAGGGIIVGAVAALKIVGIRRFALR